MSMVIKVKTALNLGAFNLWRALTYRFGLKFGINPVKRLTATIEDNDFFTPIAENAKKSLSANDSWHNQHCFFGWYIRQTPDTPNWQQNCFTGKAISADQPWWRIPDFAADVGDIKAIWEASRFDWVICFMQQACAGDAASLKKCNKWLRDWVTSNPAYLGPNWKCGQEASIRVMHLAMAALLGRQVQSANSTMQQLVAAHLARIAPTLRYAMAQDNNHGTSEAAALFIGGSWLRQLGHKDAVHWEKMGRKWLENRARRLISPDGSFSQYSVSYHRVVLDTYAMVEVWRRAHSLPRFSATLLSRLAVATKWLQHMPGVLTGDAVNLGANDGARLLPLTATDYRDFRPSLQLASALFLQRAAIAEEGSWNTPLRWLDIDVPDTVLPAPQSRLFDDGGYAVIHHPSVSLLLRYPRFKFRPSQSDVLHLDLWLKGNNLLRDAGSYSYNAEPALVNYFGGVASHNTVQFDGRDQMPRLSRFLFGAWVKPSILSDLITNKGETSFTASYMDYLGARHQRTVKLVTGKLTITDEISGFKQYARLRLRLAPAQWTLTAGILRSKNIQIEVTSDIPELDIELVEGFESRYYLQKTAVPVLEVTAGKAGKITTELRF